ncbi:Hypothetical protein PBC10988_22770 [Planctomycetales bacterium 10988]|nr:Hypothetical protein PBC10988_22770 [Planctomycetales bacterium 10988]
MAFTVPEQLLSPIRENPDDDAPRLILADWLEEHPYPAYSAWGEFIRLQCASAKLENPSPEILRRENDLLNEFQSVWFPCPLQILAPYTKRTLEEASLEIASSRWFSLKFQRGFIEECLLKAKGEAISKLFEYADYSSSLDSLFTLSSQTWRAWWKVPCLAGIKRLSFRLFYNPFDVLKTLADIPEARSLEAVDLANELRTETGPYSVGYQVFQTIADSPYLNKLSLLSIDPSLLADVHYRLKYIFDSTLLDKVKFLRFTPYRFFEGHLYDTDIEWMMRHPRSGLIQGLDVSDNALTNKGVFALCQSKHFNTVQYLDLSSNKFDSTAAEALITSPNFSHLKELNLTKNPLSPQAKSSLIQRFGKKVKF